MLIPFNNNSYIYFEYKMLHIWFLVDYLSIEDGCIVSSTGAGHSSSAVTNLLISPIPRVRSLRNKILQPVLKNSGCL